MNALVKQQFDQGRSMTAADVRDHVNLIQTVMKAVMVEDTHYGVIPGCKLPSLYKAGSEVLLTTFRIAVSLVVEDLSTPDSIRYRVHAIGTHQGSGIVVGEGIGECSSDEGKYKWRRCYIQKEFDATPESRRRIKFAQYKGDSRVTETMEVRVDPADVANTVLKMAKKRAQVDLTLTATAASDCFAQDVEDLPEELQPKATPEKATPTKGAWESMPKATQEILTGEATRIKSLIEVGDVGGAVDHYDTLTFDSDQKIALWTRFDSTERSALKKENAKRAGATHE